MSETSDLFRKLFKEGDDIRDAGLSTPDNIVRYDNIPYGEEPAWQVLDVYRPGNAAGDKLPVIIDVHGGAWVYGDKERYQYYCMNLAQMGFAVVNFTYRLAPEFQFPSPLEDTNLVSGWVMKNASQYDLDTDHIFGMGDSAGAHLLSLYAAVCTNPDCAENYSFRAPEGFELKAVALNCGVYDLQNRESLDAETPDLMKDLLPGGGTEEELSRISTVNYITPEYPPVFYMTCMGDTQKVQAPLLESRLLENDVPHEFHYFGSRTKSLGHVFHLNRRSEDAVTCNGLECSYFRRFLS